MVKKKNSEGLSGFKDVMDIIDTKKPVAVNKSREGFAVFSFLEQEQKRLIALDDLLSKKYINIKRYPQTEKLLVNEVNKKNHLRDDLFEKLKYDDSPLNKHIEQIFNSAFK